MPRGIYIRTEEIREKQRIACEGKKRGPRQEEVKERIRKALFKGDLALKRTGNHRAYFLYPILGKCELCDRPAFHRHHKDGNSLNNEPWNIQFLCAKCHMVVDGRLGKEKRDWHGHIIGYQK